MDKLQSVSFFIITFCSEKIIFSSIKVIKCENFRFIEEVEDVFKGPIFAQLAASCIIICMTLVILAAPIDNPVKFGSMVSYLLCMINQILLFCWIGNELIFSVSLMKKYW